METREVLGPIAESMASVRPARLEVCYRGEPTSQTLRLRLVGDDAAGDYLVVRGTDGLSCAVLGHIEGVQCDVGEWVVADASDVTASGGYLGTASGVGLDGFIEWSIALGTPLPTAGELYVVRRVGGDSSPGSFEDVSFALYEQFDSTSSAGWDTCQLNAVVPEAARAAADWVTPSAGYCGEPLTSCAGLPLDQKIPLENELSEDGDAFESSWKHYLRLARTAADAADALGQEVVSRGMELDRRTETALEELESLCGGPIDVEGISRPASPASGAPCMADGECPGVGEACARSGSTTGTCVHDAIAVLQDRAQSAPTAQRLLECLGDDAVYDVVGLASADLCVWRNATTKDGYCEGGSAVSRCPFRATTDSCLGVEDQNDHTGAPRGGSGTEVVAVDARLNLTRVEIEELDDPRPPPEPPCEELRELRSGNPSTPRLEELREELPLHRFFARHHLEAPASRVGWTARPMDHSAVLVEGRPWRSTGDPLRQADRPNVWPCAAPYVPGSGLALTCSGYSGTQTEMHPDLMCAYADCSDAVSRARMNQRLGRAVLAIRLATDTGLENFVPAMLRTSGNDALRGSVSNATLYDTSVTALSGIRATEVNWYYEGRDRRRGGVAYCLNSTTDLPALWNDFGSDLSAAPVKTFAGHCGPSQGRYFQLRGWGDDFKPDSDPRRTGQLWSGVGGVRPVATPNYTEEQLYGSIIAGVAAESAPLSVPNIRADGNTAFSRDRRGNEARFTSEELNAGSFRDGLELVCEVARRDHAQEGANCFDANAPEMGQMGDLLDVEAYVQCVADDFYRLAQRQLLFDLPKSVVDAIASQATLSARGEFGASAQSIRAALARMSSLPRKLNDHLSTMSREIRVLRIAMQRLEIRHRIEDNSLVARISASAAGCAAAASRTQGVGAATGGAIGAAVAICVDAAVQIGAASRISNLTHEDIDLEREQTLIGFEQRMDDIGSAIADIATEMEAATAELNSSLVSLQSARDRGRVRLAQAMVLDSDAAGRQFAVNTVLRRQFNTAQVRYERAREHAVRMAFLAKRALEQRLGVHLSELSEDMSLVEAPARWEATVCTASGIDYQRVRDSTSLDADHYADAFIGDYVTKLEQTVESYRLDFPFQEAEDTLVVSLRDDVLRVKSECVVPSHNLLARAGDLSAAKEWHSLGEEEEEAGDDLWVARGCGVASTGDEDGCVAVSEIGGLGSGDEVAPRWAPELGSPAPYRVVFGSGVDGVNTLLPSARLSQEVYLDSGWYLVSWYAREVDNDGTLPDYESAEAIAVIRDGVDLPRVSEGSDVAVADFEWERHSFFFRAEADDVYEVAIVPDSQVRTGVQSPWEHRIDVAGLMVEDVSSALSGLTSADPRDLVSGPREFVDTVGSGMSELPVCADHSGSMFRSLWQSGCERLCSAGFGEGCDDAAERCFRELPVPINISNIEKTQALLGAGFAYGNFNYRVDTVAVNIVGTSVVNCEEAESPAACYSRGSIPFSLEHSGPYFVRNYDGGETYRAPLFPGRIESGRALAAERYVGNPVSSTDRALIGDFWHREFRGRPLGGQYALRLWDFPGLLFYNIEDIQLIVKYRYWTRLN